VTQAEDRFPTRGGPRPRTTPTNPHTQLDQQPADAGVRHRLRASLAGLRGVSWQPSRISVPGAEAMVLDSSATGPAEAFMIGREFAHLHPSPDHSLHLMVPEPMAEELIAAGWAELHPVARRGLLPRTAVMIYAPRDEEEQAVVARIVQASYRFARGSAADS
jgi:hypothetical protein